MDSLNLDNFFDLEDNTNSIALDPSDEWYAPW